MFLVLLLGCAHPAARTPAASLPPQPGLRFTDVTDAAGVRFRHTNGGSGRLYLPETMGSGGGFLDYDGDGWQDLFLVNSTRLPGYDRRPTTDDRRPDHAARGAPDDRRPTSRLYRNRGDGAFAEVTREAGLELECYGMGCAAGDYDGDGDTDLYVTAMGQDRLLRNERVPSGTARFVDATPATMRARNGDAPHWGTSAAWVDYDRDGDLDLFVCRYARWSTKVHRVCSDAQGRPHGCTPDYYQGDPSVLYRNDGAGAFTDVTRAAGVYRPQGKSLGVAVTDVDGDGRPDLLVANDQEPNNLFRNNGDGTFTDEAVVRGVAYSMEGQARAGMGVDTLDVPGRPAEAIFVGNREGEGHAFFFPDREGHYTDRAHDAGIFEPGLSSLTFGALFVDYDLDGHADLITANGHVEPNIELLESGVTLAQRLLVFHGERPDASGPPRFQEVGAALGTAMATRRVWRGLAWADYDRDGDPDFLVTACNGRPMLLRNDALRSPLSALRRAGAESREQRAESRPHWLKVRLEGRKSNRQGLGSRVSVEVGGRRRSGWVRSGSSYCSTSEAAALFGLGDAGTVDSVTVRWAGGSEQTVRGVGVDREIVIREGVGASEVRR